MRKQGELYLKIITLVLAALLLAYILFSLIQSGGKSGYALETAVLCEVGDGLSVSGFVVRSETVLTCAEQIIVCELTEGERVGAGQRLATVYQSGEARRNREQQTALQAQLDQLTQAASMDSGSAASLDNSISDLLVQLAAQTDQQRFDAMQSTAVELQPLILRSSITDEDSAKIESKIAEMKQSIAALGTGNTGGSTAILAETSGYYSEITDGYESVLTPEALDRMTVAELRDIESRRAEVSAGTIGRLVERQKWYFVAEVPAERVADCDVGDRLTVSFAAQELQELRMRVERIGETEGESCLLVLSCEKMLQNVTALREQTANIVFSTYEGLRVPKQALYFLNGSAGVYVLESARAEWKKVEIIYEYGDSYLVEWDDTDTDNLWPKDEIILTSEDIEDGRVME